MNTEIYKLVVLENSITLFLMVILIVSLYLIGAGNYSLWGLLMMLNIKYVKSNQKEKENES